MHRRRRRLGVGLVLLALLVSSLLHYSAAAPREELTDRSTVLLASDASHVGESVYVWGTVTAVDGKRLQVVVGDTRALVVGTDGDAERGDLIQVAGTLRGDDVIEADRVVVSARGDRLRMFGVSLVGVVLVAVSFRRYWRVNLRELVVEAR